MDCSRFEQQLSEYLDGQLEAAASSLLAAHALQCRECRQLLDEVKFAINECKREDEIPSFDQIESALIKIGLEHRAIDCPAFEEIITEFLDGFVPAAVYHRFEAHSASCQKCSTLLTDVVYAVAACHSVHTYEEYEPPQALIERLEALMPA
ncbi:MAG TPA: zf-HC2 domain-containing protein, partial [Blastocatellia bacterium]|nr:zf-HC2 domain-containing protein [Blastocatellia bacterium]